jgi:hypothetical protein
MSREAMQMALEALECALSDDKPYIVKSKEAITSLRQALVDADDTSQERVDETVKCKHEWVGLTDEEKSDLWCESTGRDWVNEDTHVFADAIEAKLKEKNHG